LPDLDFAESDTEASERARQWREIDPFPNIAPSLLNSADILDYARITGMIFPFYPRPELMKPASYKIAIGGEYVYWDEFDQRQADTIEQGKELVLRANSIAFVALEPTIRLPLYIAVRFNLRVAHVYKGLLLGTGPLVDPGFEGHLSIPLHNLTTNDYRFRGGEGLIWAEFTKVNLAPGLRVAESPPERSGRLFGLGEAKEYKPYRSVQDYLTKADPQRSIRSSVPDIVEQAKSASAAAASASQAAGNEVRLSEQARRQFLFRTGLATLVSVLVVIAAVAAILIQVHQLVTEVNSRIDNIPTPPPIPSASPAPSVLNQRLCAVEQQLKLPQAASCK